MSNDFNKKFAKLKTWEPPKNWQRVKVIDAHTGGEPLRIIVDGFPEIKGNTILEKRKYLKNNLDYLRTALMWEPRGHADMYGSIITPPLSTSADFGLIFMHNEGYSTMCGHGIIAATKVVLETGMFSKTEPLTQLKIDTPAGLITSYAKVKKNGIESVYFHNVPSFVYSNDQEIAVSGLGVIKYDIAFGGAFYAIVDADALNISLNYKNTQKLITMGMLIKHAIMKKQKIEHPFEPDLSFLYGTIFTGKSLIPNVDSKNVCIFAEGEVDRSPTGTGVSARLALHYRNKKIQINEPMIIESIAGSKFSGKVIETTKFWEYDAVIPEVEGSANINGVNEILIDPKDPFKNGFILR